MEPKLVLLVAFTAGALAGPINTRVVRDPFKCAEECVPSHKFKYAAGSTYEYTYKTNTRTTIAGAAEHYAGVFISADVRIEAMTSCEMMMTLSDVRIHRSDPNSPRRMAVGDNSHEFQQTLEAYPLRFSFQDGVVDQVCPEVEESTWALNIKRGVLSSFQNSMTDLQRDERVKETDVTGECCTDYRVTQRGWKASTITKTKDLLGCDSRHGFKTSLTSLPYKMPNTLKSLPLLKSEHECKQTVTSDGLLQETVCSETHVFRPFSKENNGAMTEASATLQYKRMMPYIQSRQGQISSRASLTFEHTYGLRDEDVKKHDASTKLEQLCRMATTDIRPEVPELFSELVTILKNANYRTLEALYRQIQSQEICASNKMGRKFFIDAIPMVGSVSSLRMMRQLIDDKAVDNERVDMWLTSLAFIQIPTVEMIQEVQPLMDSYDSQKSTLLIAAMVHNFCLKTNRCTEIPVIDRIISQLERGINRGCVVNDANHEDILITLRAIGNIGQAERLALSLEPCFTREENPMEIRIAALDAFRRLPCGADRNNALELYQSSNEDAELRIAAYIVVMQCPGEAILSQIQETLSTEKANQVGSFVWTHLLNLQETSSPFKQEVKKILEDEELSKEFNLDKRKFSRNYEGSLYSEKLNAGAMIESNLIWSSKSFIPRSAMVNLTVDLFGQSVNLFELGGRIEGLESILQTFLGPEADTKPSNRKAGYENTRAVRNEKMDRIKQKYDQVEDDLHASVFLRIFGNELSYMHFDSDNWPLKKNKFNFLEFLQKLSQDHDYSFTNNHVFLDSSIIVPTCGGLPLNLTVNGAASVHVTAKGKVDLNKAAKKPRSLLIDGHIKPSGAVEITGTMIVDAFVTKTGLKVVTSAHSSTSLQGKVELSRSQLFNLELDLPQDKMEIFNIKSNFFIVHDKEEREQRMIEDNRKSRKLCWGCSLIDLTGVELCGEVGFPNASMLSDSPYFPLTGPVNFGITLNKRDTHTGYKMAVKSILSPEKVLGQFMLDTPGSKEKRTLSVDLAVDKKEKTLVAGITSPWKEVSFKSSLLTEGEDKRLKGVLLIDKTHEYSCDAVVIINTKDNRVTYEPTVKLQKLDSKVTFLTGKISRECMKTLDVDLNVTPFNSRTVNLKAGYANTETEKRICATYSRSKKDSYSFLARTLISRVRSSTRVQPTLVISIPKKDLITFKGSAEYKTDKAFKMDATIGMDKFLKSPMKFKADLSRVENVKRKRLKFKGNTQLISEFLNFKLGSSMDKKKGGSVSSQVSMDYNMPGVKKNKVTFSTKFIDKSSKTTKKYKINANFDVKQHQDYNMMINTEVSSSAKSKEVQVKFRHGKNVGDTKNKDKELFVHLKTQHKVSPLGVTANIDYSFKITYPFKDIKIDGKGHHSHDKKNLASTITVDYGKKKTAHAAFKLRDRTRNRLINMEGTFDLSYPGWDMSLTSNVTQKSKTKYIHTVNINLQKGNKTSFYSAFEMPSKNHYKLSSEAVIHGYKPAKFEGFIIYPCWRNVSLSAIVTRNNSKYGFTSEHLILDMSGNLEIEVLHPKKAVFRIEGGKRNDQYETKFDTRWTSENGDESSITSTVSFVNQDRRNRRIGGNFEIVCPFEKFKGCSGEFDFSNKNNEVTVKGSAGWGRKKISASASMDKPFKIENLGLSLAATTPFEGYETLEFSVANKYDKSILTQGKVIIGPHNGQVKFNAEYVLMPTNRDIKAGFELKSSHRTYKIVSVSVSHRDDMTTSDSKIRYNDNGDIYGADLTLNFINTKININGKGGLIMISPNHKIKTCFEHEHKPYFFKTVFNTDWGRGQKISVVVNGDYKKVINTEVSGGVLIQTPWQPLNDLDIILSSQYSPSFMKVNGYTKSKRQTLVSIDSNYRRRHGEVDFDISVTGSALPDDITGKLSVPEYLGNPKRGHAEVEWGTAKKISLDMFIDLQLERKSLDSSLRLTTPFKGADTIFLKYTNKKQASKWVSKVSAEIGLDSYITGETHFSLENKMLRLTIDSSNPEMQQFDACVELPRTTAGDFKLKGDLEIRPILDKLSGELTWIFNASEKSSLKLRVDTPFPRFPFLRFTASHQPTQKGKASCLEIEYHPKHKIEVESTYDFKCLREFLVETTLKTSYEKYPKFATEVAFKLEKLAMKGRANVKTDFENLEDICFNLELPVNLRQMEGAFTGKVEASYGSVYRFEQEICYELNGTDIVLQSKQKTVWQRNEHNTSFRISKKGSLDGFNAELCGQYNGKIMEAAATFKKDKVSIGSINVTTPFENYDNLSLTFDFTGDENKFTTSSALNVRNGAKYETHMEWMNHKFRRIETHFKLKTPHRGHEAYQLNYAHSLRREKFVLETDLYNGMTKTSSLDCVVDYSKELTATLNICTSFQGFKHVHGSYEKKGTVHSIKANADVGENGTITAQSSFDTSGEPYTGNVRINTSFKGYENIRICFRHEGTLRQFKSSTEVNFPRLTPINADLSWKYDTLDSMEGQFTMTSGLKNMEDLRIGIKNSRSGNSFSFYNELGWQKEKVITVDQYYSLKENKGNITVSAHFTLSAPFKKVSCLNLKLDHMHNQGKIAEKFIADFNGKSYFDGDMNYAFERRHECSINIRSIRPMSMTLGAQVVKNHMCADISLNWNTDDLESNIKIETAYNDQSAKKGVDTDFKLKLIHPVRTMGIEGIVKKLPDSMHNKALITWDQKNGKTFAYDIQWNDRNRPYRQARDASIKIVIPMRSVKVSGSYTNSTSVKTLETSLLWDADKHLNKQVLVKLDMDQKGKSVQRSVHLHLPYIKKDYKLKTYLVKNQGNMIVDGSTEFSYSDDPRKTLTLTTKMENLGYSNNNNYSLTLGINHPSTYTNLMLNSHMGHSVTSCSGGLLVSYEARNRDKKYFVLRGEVNRKEKQLNIQASSPLKHVLLIGRMDKSKPYHLALTNRYDHEKVVSTDVTIDTDRRTLEIGFAYNSEDPQDSIHLSAGYVNDSAIQATVFRKSGVSSIHESDISMRLNTSHILHTRITWRPCAVEELQKFVAAKAQVYSYVMNEAASEISQAMGQEVSDKYRKIANEIYTEVKPVFTMLEKELGDAKCNLDQIRTELRRAYSRNDLFIKDMGDAVNRAFNEIFGEFGHFVDAFDEFYTKTEQTLTAWLNLVKNYPISEKYMQFVDQLVQDLKQARKIGEANMKLLAYKMEQASDMLYRFYLTHTRAMHRKFNAIQQSILNHPQVRGLKATYADFKSRVTSLPKVDYHRYGQLFDEAIQKALEHIHLKDAYNKAIASTRKVFQQQLEAIKSNPDFKKAQDISNEIYQQLVWAYKYWDLDTNLRETMVRLFQVSRDLVFLELNRLKDSLVDLDKSRVIVYDPLRGELQIELYLPVPLKSLAQVPDFNIHCYIRKVKIFIQRYVPGSNYSIWDTYYKIVPSLDSNSWLPPYKAYAAVIGNQHFITFDQSNYDFAGRCSYILTRDMVDDNFTVVLNYDNNIRAPKKKSLLVMLRDANIEVDKCSKVTINNQPMELPFTRGDIEVVRESHQIVIDDGGGLMVQIDPEHDIITIGLSGWYHGRVAGLLGTLDNEQGNDLTSAERQILSDITQFANSWEVGRRSCRSSNMATNVNLTELESSYADCVKYFQSQTSHFRQCFSVVPPAEFLHACVGYMQNGKSAESARCLTAGQYFHQCRTNGVYLQMPKDCVTCKLTEGLEPISQGEAVQLNKGDDSTPLPTSADVVLVLEEKRSKQWTPATLGDLVTAVDSALTSTGISKNRFGLVGYGGPGRLMTGHSHTFDGHLFTQAKGFLKGVENIVFSDSTLPADGLCSLKKATNYPFRAGVAKILLYIPSSCCEANKAHVDMDAILKTNGFIMHILRNTVLDIDDNRPVKNAHIFGMDTSKIITMRQRQVRNQQMFENLVHPTDSCAKLALATNGSVFDSTHMGDSNNRVRKYFIKAFASRVSETSAPPMCQTCKCEQDDDGLGKTVCRPCDKASFLWKYMPNWWSAGTSHAKQDLKKQIQNSLLELREWASINAPAA